MPRLSFFSKGIVVGLTLLITLLSSLNYWLKWNFLGAGDKKVMVACYVLLAIVMLKWLPTRAEWDEYRKQRGAG
jgi:hypothetical protein